MRTTMFAEHNFAVAVFIGGMQGVIAEFELLRSIQPTVKLLPIVSTGGAAATLQVSSSPLSADLFEDLDYISLFHRHLGVSVKEERLERPAASARSGARVRP